jgi:hypothetical protein
MGESGISRTILTTCSADLDQIDTPAGLSTARAEYSSESIAFRCYNRNNEGWTELYWEKFTVEVCRWQAGLLAGNPGNTTSANEKVIAS